jgi:Tol biopolymer transport system component
MTIAVTTKQGGRWQDPEVASFSGRYSEVDPFPAPDGERLFYTSKRPVTGAEESGNFDIWFVDREGAEWSAPNHLEGPVNTDGDEYYPAVAADGTLYFSAARDDSRGSFDLYRSRLVDGRYGEPENLGEAINSESAEIDVFIAPEQDFIIFVSYRAGGQGRGDLYISYQRDGAWTPAENLGDLVNSPAREYCPFVSPDGRYLFFTSERAFTDDPLARALTFDELTERIRAPKNGMGDVYRLSLDALGVER